MSDSRLEKFIYALCSMDVSDLPVPLSRIEKLWNCLITGETPDFEPLSRNEKYLMAMLDRYDISNLPAPMSRGEKLLYKIVVGETDLSDVPGYLSRYEELLKYLIENGEISEDDFEYVLYTLNQSLHTLYLTAEKPVKKAIVYGDTLVNTLQESSSLSVTPMGEAIDTQQATITGTANGVIKSAILKGNTLVNLVTQKSGSFNGTRFLRIPLSRTLNSNTNYFIKFNLRESSLTDGVVCRLRIGINGNVVGSLESDGIITVTGDGYNYIEFYIKNAVDVTNGLDGIVDDIMIIEYQDDMENWDIPYFDGMQSVKMPVLKTTGKNVFSGDNSMELGAWRSNGNSFETSSEIRCKNNYTPFPNGLNNGDVVRIVLSDTSINSDTNMHVYDENKTYGTSPYIEGTDFINGVSTVTIHDASKCKYFSFRAVSTNTECKFAIMVNTSAPYEPYKSNILTVNEDVTLCGIGDVRDTLDLMTGELVQRIGEIKITDEMIDKFTVYGNFINNFNSIFNGLPERKIETFTKNSISMVSDKMVAKAWADPTMAENIVYFSQYRDGEVRVTHSPDWTLDEFKAWFRENKPTIQYELATPTIKTVDLTVVDQDGNTVPHLQAFNETTHISTSSTGLFPNVVIPATVSYPSIIKPSTLYTVKLKRSVTSGTLMINAGGTEQAVTSDCFTMTTPSTLTSQDVIFSGKGNVISEVTVVEGDQTSKEYGYFEGMQSVKMPVLTTTGSNMVNPTDIEVIGCKSYDVDSDGIANIVGDTTGYWARSYIRYTHHLKANTTYYIYCDGDSTGTIHAQEWIDNINTGRFSWSKFYSYTPEADVLYEVRIFLSADESPFTCSKIRIGFFETTTKPSSYEPYKSNILTVNEDVELRGIGQGSNRVEDELNCLTGEVTESIGEIVLDGKNDVKISISSASSNYPSITRFWLRDEELSNLLPHSGERIMCDKLPVRADGDYEKITASNGFDIHITTSKLSEETVEAFKEYLSQNPITVQYPLKAASLKTVDLTVVDQDNQPTQLGTFENVTHVSLEAENLIPEVEMEVATHISEELASASPLMDDISTEQQQLNTTIDEQSENVDATMIATTEIFEETL